jgi:hypothetical protein
MQSSAPEMLALQRVAELEPSVMRLELRLSELASTLCRRDAGAIEAAASALHKALAAAIDDFRKAAMQGGVPPQLRQRLVSASGQVAAQREALARATASLDRAIDVLLPDAARHNVYDAYGTTTRFEQSGVQA